MMTLLPLAELRTDGGTQPRAVLDDAIIDEYAADLRNGAVFPPVVVFFDGAVYWLADGFHRWHAHARANRNSIEAEVRQGTLAEAQWYSYSVNQSHGLRRTNEDKRRAVEAALRHEFAGRYSGEQIAKHCGVSNATVSRYREAISYNVRDEPPTPFVIRNGHTYPMQTANIGKRNGQTAASEQEPPRPTAHSQPMRTEPEPAGVGQAVFGDRQPDPQRDITPDTAAGAAEPHAEAVRITGRSGAGVVTIRCADAQDGQWYEAHSAHLVISSPPYNVGIAYGAHDDALPDAAYWALLATVTAQCYRALVVGGRIALVVPRGVGRNPWLPFAPRVADVLTEAGFTLRGSIVWDKATTGNRTSWGSFRLSSNPSLRDTTEEIIIAHKAQASLPLPENVVLHDDKGSYTDWLADPTDFMALAQDHWSVAPESSQRIGHPAPFPVALVERLLRFYGYPGCHVLDPFAGSGTVGVAALKLRCRATLFDIDADYCQLAAARCQEAADAQA